LILKNNILEKTVLVFAVPPPERAYLGEEIREAYGREKFH